MRCSFARAQEPSAATRTVLDKAGVQRGLAVVMSDRPAPLALELAQASNLLMYVQLPAADRVEALRKAADREGMLGTRIFVQQIVKQRGHRQQPRSPALSEKPGF